MQSSKSGQKHQNKQGERNALGHPPSDPVSHAGLQSYPQYRQLSTSMDFLALDGSGLLLLFFFSTFQLCHSSLAEQVDSERDLSACLIKGLMSKKAEAID